MYTHFVFSRKRGQSLLLDSYVVKKKYWEVTSMRVDKHFTWYPRYGMPKKYFYFNDVIDGVKTKHSCLGTLLVLSYAKTWKENLYVCNQIMCCHLWWLLKFTRDGSTKFKYIHIYIHKNWHAFSEVLWDETSVFEIVFSVGTFLF